jgi:ssDNA-binding Zn-finger/Zn-ribbon topoisomerase 1
MKSEANLPDNTPVERSCPRCGPTVRLLVKTNRHNGTQFLGCPRWPECDHTEPVPEALRMQALGAQRLPGF